LDSVKGGRVKKLVAVLTIVAFAAMTITAGAEASKRKVLCGNFGGSGPTPRLAHTPASCNLTTLGRNGTVKKLRSMHWGQWGGIAKGKGLVNGKQRAVRLRKTRPCGQHDEFSVYSQMRIGAKKWRKILYCGD
jgi:hypothetical protein